MSWGWLFWWRPPALLRVVMVNLRSGDAIQGVLWQSRGRWLVLRQSTGLSPGSQPRTIDGEVLIDRENVAFIQVLP